MANKFVVPVGAFIAGVLVWVAFLVWHETGGGTNEGSPWLDAGLCLLAGGLVVFSAVRCRRVGGPRVGSVVRAVVLVVLAAITYWRAGVGGAAVLAAGAVSTGALALAGTGRPASAEIDAYSSSQAGKEAD